MKVLIVVHIYAPANVVKRLTTIITVLQVSMILSQQELRLVLLAIIIVLKGLVTGTKVRVLGVPYEDWIITTNYYDKKNRLIQSSREISPDGVSIVSNEYDFVGNVLRTKEFQVVSEQLKIIDTHFTYDHRGRLLTVKQAVDNQTPHMLAEMIYN